MAVRRSRGPMLLVLLETLTAATLVVLASLVLAVAVWLPLGLLGLPLLLAALRSSTAIVRILGSPAPRVVLSEDSLAIHHPELASPAILASTTVHSVWTGPFAEFGRTELPGRTWLLGGVLPPDPKTAELVLLVLHREVDLPLAVRSRFPFAWRSAANTTTRGELSGGEPTIRLRGLCIRTAGPIPQPHSVGDAHLRPGLTMPRTLAEWLKNDNRPAWSRT